MTSETVIKVSSGFNSRAREGRDLRINALAHHLDSFNSRAREGRDLSMQD